MAGIRREERPATCLTWREVTMEQTAEYVTLTEASWAEFRTLRLRALAEEPLAFGQTYDIACTFPETFWRGRLRDAAEGVSWLICARTGADWWAWWGRSRPTRTCATAEPASSAPTSSLRCGGKGSR